MPRKLKTFVTESGFFELAVAAPSMKAALSAWGFSHNLFQQGLARQSHDLGIVAATVAEPGQVLRRPIGSKAQFSRTAALPKVGGRAKAVTAKRKAGPRREPERGTGSARQPQGAVDLKAIRAARAEMEKAEKRYRRSRMLLAREREGLERRQRLVEENWRQEKERLEEQIRRLKGPPD